MTGGRTPVRDIPGTFEVANVNEKIAPRLVGLQVTQQKEIDKLMVEVIDGTQNDWGWSKSTLGANATLAVSMAVCRAGAASMQMPLCKYIANPAGRPTDKFMLPVPSFNVINGGSHAGNRLADEHTKRQAAEAAEQSLTS